jgi:hypothetical protein
MNEPEDYEYSGRRSRFPPVWQLLGYFGLGIGGIIVAFDDLKKYKAFENTTLHGGFQPLMRVNWFGKFLYETGGKYAVFGTMLVFGVLFLGFGIWRLWSWFRLRNSN